jgi:hypothetical protein
MFSGSPLQMNLGCALYARFMWDVRTLYFFRLCVGERVPGYRPMELGIFLNARCMWDVCTYAFISCVFVLASAYLVFGQWNLEYF